MSDQEINKAIAEACGWGGIQHSDAYSCWQGYPPGNKVFTVPIPDYCNDLNAMHEAEKVLTPPPNELNAYAEILMRISRDAGNHYTFMATARQRSEALLRTIGKWPEKGMK